MMYEWPEDDPFLEEGEPYIPEEKASLVPLIDADSLLYKAGFASQHKRFRFHSDSAITELYSNTTIKAKKETEGQEGYIEEYTDVESVGLAINNLSVSVQVILNSLEDLNFNIDEPIVYVAGIGVSNFRDDIATTQPYKGNRLWRYDNNGEIHYCVSRTLAECFDEMSSKVDKVIASKFKKPAGKPYHYEALRQWLVHAYNTLEIRDVEVDDAIGLAQCKNTILCHLDKDLWQVPGHHWDYGKQKYLYVDPDSLGILELTPKGDLFGTYIAWFYAQMLLGDSADHIRGITKVGPKKAFKLLGSFETEYDLFGPVVNEYKREFNDNWKQRFFENAQLLWIQRHGEVDVCPRLTKLIMITGA